MLKLSEYSDTQEEVFLTCEQIRNHPEVIALLERGDYNLGVLGYTDHSMAHCAPVAERAAYILRRLAPSSA